MMLLTQTRCPIQLEITTDKGALRQPTIGGSAPFSWCSYDSFLPLDVANAALHAFPSPDSKLWVKYDSPGERKLALNKKLPPECESVLAEMDAICPTGLVVDESRHGSGLHMMPHDGVLDLHLDADVHPRTGFRRAANAILFLGRWHADAWGGCLEFWDEHKCCVKIAPQHNRLVVFETSDKSYHGVPRAMTAPPGQWRKSMAVYWWEPGEWLPKRPRASFMALPGEEVSPEKALWQRSRCQEGVQR